MFEIFCSYTGSWSPLGRSKTRCPKCGGGVRMSQHQVREVPAAEMVFCIVATNRRTGKREDISGSIRSRDSAQAQLERINADNSKYGPKWNHKYFKIAQFPYRR